ncbi:MAG: fibronectin type III domain-containing protein, partial [Bacillota bacterium]
MLLRRAVALLAITLLVLGLVPVRSVRADTWQETKSISRYYPEGYSTRDQSTVLTFSGPIQGGTLRLWLSGDFDYYSETYALYVEGQQVWYGRTGRQDWPPVTDRSQAIYIGEFPLPSACVGKTQITITGRIYPEVYFARDWIDVVVTVATPPYVPGKPVLGGGSPSYWNVRVSWSANGNPSGTQYELWRKTLNPDGSVAEDKAIYSGTATEFTTTDQTSGRYYLYRVRAYYNGKWSNFSAETSYWTAPGFSSVTPEAGKISLSWPKVKDGLTYRVWWRPEGGSWQNTTTTSLSCTISSLSPLVRYTVCLSPVLSEGGNDWWAGGNQAVPLAYAPGSGSLSATQTSVTASWTANGNPSGVSYYAELRNQGGSVLASSGWTTALSWTFSGLSPGTPYRVYVKARNAAGVETSWTYLGERYTIPPKPAAPSGSFGALD